MKYRSGRKNGLWGILEGSFFKDAASIGAATLRTHLNVSGPGLIDTGPNYLDRMSISEVDFNAVEMCNFLQE